MLHEIIAYCMDNKKTKPLKVTEIQQKAFDVYSFYWKEIWAFVLFVLAAGGWGASLVTSSGDDLNKIRAEYDQKVESVISREKKDCQETLKNYTKFIESINPNVKSSSSDLSNRKQNEK